MIPTYKNFRIGAVETGARGKPGKSAYELWLENGNKGTIEDFLNSLRGRDGKPGRPGAKGDKGDPGVQGIQGEPGVQGEHGVDSVYEINVEGKHGVMKYSNGVIECWGSGVIQEGTNQLDIALGFNYTGKDYSCVVIGEQPIPLYALVLDNHTIRIGVKDNVTNNLNVQYRCIGIKEV
ncbi:hypothetical protein cpx_00017 [Clostridium phage cpx]|nr:hypothetical protein cpx_00017 [Clostridium phage cpx]